MRDTDFEEAFGNFLEREEYDAASIALFTVVRAAYLAGWKAAGGDPPKAQPVVWLVKDEDSDKDNNITE